MRDVFLFYVLGYCFWAWYTSSHDDPNSPSFAVQLLSPPALLRIDGARGAIHLPSGKDKPAAPAKTRLLNRPNHLFCPNHQLQVEPAFVHVTSFRKRPVRRCHFRLVPSQITFSVTLTLLVLWAGRPRFLFELLRTAPIEPLHSLGGKSIVTASRKPRHLCPYTHALPSLITLLSASVALARLTLLSVPIERFLRSLMVWNGAARPPTRPSILRPFSALSPFGEATAF